MMIIKASTALRNDYAGISNLAKETNEPIYIEAFEKREQMLKLRERVLKAEQERIEGQPTMSVSEARRRLRERANEV